jgi:hypothetical protein
MIALIAGLKSYDYDLVLQTKPDEDYTKIAP